MAGLGGKVCVSERGAGRGRERLLPVIFELERFHVYLAQAINSNLLESFSPNVNAQK